jgi:predicted ATPase
MRRGRSERAPSLVTSHVVGRDDILAALREAWDSVAHGGRGQVVLVGGADSGKTEMLGALRTYATASGGAVLAAECSPYGHVVTLQPIADAIQAFGARERTQVVQHASVGVEAEVTDLVPDLLPVLGAVPRMTLNDRLRMDALRSFVRRLSERGPVLVGLDDFHLADHATIAALHRLSTAGARRVLIAVTVQDTDADTVIGALGDDAQRLILDPLTLGDVVELADRWRVPHAAAQVHALTGGVPGLVVQALRAVADGAQAAELSHLVPGLDEAVRDHLRAADDSVIELLAIAAAVGPKFRVHDLIRLGFSLLDAMSTTQRALGHGLLVAQDDMFVFASELVHAAALSRIPDPIRQAIQLTTTTDHAPMSPAVVGLGRRRRPRELDGLDPAS